jgi:tetratricopeptide (TPR) repeat protein
MQKTENATHRCDQRLGASPFTNPDATHILIADFYGLHPDDRQFATSVSEQIDVELRRFQEEDLPQMPVRVAPESVEFRRIACFLDSHAEAERVAQAVDADLVIWGRAYCNPPIPQRPVQIEQRISVSEIHASDQATVKVGQIYVEGSKPFSICPSATLHRASTRLRKSTRSLDIATLSHLDLPALASTKPFQLINFTLGLHFYERGQPWIAARFFQSSADEVLSPVDANLGPLYAYLARSFIELPGGAELALKYARASLEKVAGVNGTEESGLLGIAGYALEMENRGDDALVYYQRALDNDMRRGGDDLVTAVDLNHIGLIHRDNKDYDTALVYYKRALDIIRRTSGENSEAGTILNNNIGYALWGQGKLDDALEYYTLALKISEDVLGKDHPVTATRLNNIALVRFQQGKMDEALEMYRRALTIDEEALGADHPTTAAVMENIGLVLEAKGELEEARKDFERSLVVLRKSLGDHHPETITLLSYLGEFLMHQGDTIQGINYLSLALTSAAAAFGEDDPKTAEARGRLDEAIAETLTGGGLVVVDPIVSESLRRLSGRHDAAGNAARAALRAQSK